VLCAVVLAFVQADAKADKITSLPGYTDPIRFNQYAGYLLANATNNRNLFYWFVESQNNPSTDPVVLWMNGGPGCSSLAGFMSEHSPFTLQTDGKTLKTNPFSWNRVANVIYLESPVGVGYSYSDNPKIDYNQFNDDKTANDVYHALVSFFAKFPQYRSNEFYVSGESYAGHYVPVSTYHIHMGNLQGGNPRINLKGFVVGNGVTDGREDTNSIPPFMFHHALISQAYYENSLKVCSGDFYKNQNVPQCSEALNNMFVIIAGVNPYWLAGPCEGDPSPFASAEEALQKRDLNGTHPLFQLWRMAKKGSNGGAPCIDSDPETTYFNTPEVKKAIHAREDIKWEFCSDSVNEKYDRSYDSMLPFYAKLLNSGYRALVYTGDMDMAVNSLGTEMSLTKLAEMMKSTVVDTWRTWTYESSQGYGKQVGGMTMTYSNNLQFTTARSCGHMVPSTCPSRGFTLFSKWLANKPL